MSAIWDSANWESVIWDATPLYIHYKYLIFQLQLF
jgi:hypothetical protein